MMERDKCGIITNRVKGTKEKSEGTRKGNKESGDRNEGRNK